MPNLVGIGNSQVPTNAMLGRLAYQDSVSEHIIEKIKAKITPYDTTVRDIFVYDTRKDSDGGAWRKKQPHSLGMMKVQVQQEVLEKNFQQLL